MRVGAPIRSPLRQAFPCSIYDGCKNSTVLPSGSLTIAILTPGRISVIGMNGLMPLVSSRSSRPLIIGYLDGEIAQAQRFHRTARRRPAGGGFVEVNHLEVGGTALQTVHLARSAHRLLADLSLGRVKTFHASTTFWGV
jgi:hypothetical protein